MNILDKIIETKKVEVANQKKVVSVARLEKYPLFSAKAGSGPPGVDDRAVTGPLLETILIFTTTLTTISTFPS